MDSDIEIDDIIVNNETIMCQICLAFPLSGIMNSENCIHTMCASCHSSYADYRCPTCRIGTQWFMNHFMTKLCMDALIDCNDCKEKVRVRDISRHVKECKFRKVMCPGCGELKVLNSKEMIECVSQVVECGFCTNTFPSGAISLHMQQCLSREEKCKYCVFRGAMWILNHHMAQNHKDETDAWDSTKIYTTGNCCIHEGTHYAAVTNIIETYCPGESTRWHLISKGKKIGVWNRHVLYKKGDICIFSSRLCVFHNGSPKRNQVPLHNYRYWTEIWSPDIRYLSHQQVVFKKKIYIASSLSKDSVPDDSNAWYIKHTNPIIV
jgi:hypothetical protein